MNSSSFNAVILVDMKDLFDYLFPNNIQHPLVFSRLVIYALYGPLDDKGNLRSGFQKSHILKDYEIDSMSIQIEREDIINIYSSKSGLIPRSIENSIISQADNKLKIAKGKAMMPVLKKDDILNILKVK